MNFEKYEKMSNKTMSKNKKNECRSSGHKFKGQIHHVLDEFSPYFCVR